MATTAQHQHKLTNAAQVKVFIRGGNSTFTVVSVATGARFTFRVQVPKATNGPASHFVKVLTGPNNDSDYTFLGTLYGGTTFHHGKRSTIGADAPSAKAFAWLWAKVVQAAQTGGELPQAVEFWTSGKCARCGRTLTVDSSVLMGFGPECAGLAKAA